jgi:hypothetical protein
MFGTTGADTPEDSAAADDRDDRSADPATLILLATAGVAMLAAGFASILSRLMVLPLLLPWAVLAWSVSRRREAIIPRNRRQFDIASVVAIAGPSLLLAVNAFVTAPLHDTFLTIALPGSAIAAACAAAFLGVVPAARAMPLLPAVVVACLGYGFGGAVTANLLFDRSAPQLERVRVLDKWVGRRSVRQPASEPPSMLELESFGTVRVDATLRNQVEVGSLVCVRTRDGALRIEWFVVERCQ